MYVSCHAQLSLVFISSAISAARRGRRTARGELSLAMLRHLPSISLIMLLPSLVSSFRCPPPKQPAFFAAGTGVCLWCAAAAASAVVDVDIDAVAAAAEPSWFGKVAMQPGFKLEYEEYMDAAGNIRSAPSKVQSTSSTWLLLLVSGATRFGGILPDGKCS